VAQSNYNENHRRWEVLGKGFETHVKKIAVKYKSALQLRMLTWTGAIKRRF
jgi:hypothetical protein